MLANFGYFVFSWLRDENLRTLTEDLNFQNQLVLASIHCGWAFRNSDNQNCFIWTMASILKTSSESQNKIRPQLLTSMERRLNIY